MQDVRHGCIFVGPVCVSRDLVLVPCANIKINRCWRGGRPLEARFILDLNRVNAANVYGLNGLNLVVWLVDLA